MSKENELASFKSGLSFIIIKFMVKKLNYKSSFALQHGLTGMNATNFHNNAVSTLFIVLNVTRKKHLALIMDLLGGS